MFFKLNNEKKNILLDTDETVPTRRLYLCLRLFDTNTKQVWCHLWMHVFYELILTYISSHAAYKLSGCRAYATLCKSFKWILPLHPILTLQLVWLCNVKNTNNERCNLTSWERKEASDEEKWSIKLIQNGFYFIRLCFWLTAPRISQIAKRGFFSARFVLKAAMHSLVNSWCIDGWRQGNGHWECIVQSKQSVWPGKTF